MNYSNIKLYLFELYNIFEIFQYFTNDIFNDYLDDFLIIYLDDLFIYSKILKEYKWYIRQILEYLHEIDLYIKSEKYQFHV